ncbi:ATP-binding cassette domain-containing protein [Pedobacter sp. HMF7647]|uniref:ATP-binding cassette domain-containing protein n=1 Tax=Hufsiella arboris TaxID=2695275 RepID=A0A7K1Y6U0_9SPHI|nr:ABC transporter ATP-binding protein [Hufsiella arboris]MXV49839.1 ATP-binding cassette domain-containing protein [Hufsiella arboris]
MSEPIISIKNLRKNYGEKQVLKGIDLQINAGQVIGYIGPNGAGKSTTVKILIGLIPDFEGEIIIGGQRLHDNLLDIKRVIGYVPENAELYEVLTPMEYLEFVGKLQGMEQEQINHRSQAMLSQFGLKDVMNQRMDTFSKGMRQKVLLISGMIHNPQIIILDEPLSGLDANAVILVKEIISRLAQEGKTIFYCSHMMDVVEKVSDRIILINDGEIVADGSFTELQNNSGGTLEQIFAKLTGKGNIGDAAGAFINAFD